MWGTEIVDFFHPQQKAVAGQWLHLLSNTNQKIELWLQIGVEDAGIGACISDNKNKTKKVCAPVLLGQCSWSISQRTARVHLAENNTSLPHFAPCGREDRWVNCPEELFPVRQAREEYFSKEIKEEQHRMKRGWNDRIVHPYSYSNEKRLYSGKKKQKAITSVPVSPKHPNVE